MKNMAMDNANWQFGGVGQPPMEPIIEEDDYLSPSCSYAAMAPGGSTHTTPSRRHNRVAPSGGASQATTNAAPAITECRVIESKQRVREIHTTEEIDTLVSTLPREAVPESWKNIPSEHVVLDANMAHTYLIEMAGGVPAARSSKYTYTYETHVDEPEASGYGVRQFGGSLTSLPRYSASPGKENTPLDVTPYGGALTPIGAGAELERHSTSTQKVTRVTKITTTRSLRQVPVDPDDVVFDAVGNPKQNGHYDDVADCGLLLRDGVTNGVDVSRTFISEHEEYSMSPATTTSPATAFPADPYPSGQQALTTVGHETYAMLPSTPGIPQLTDISQATISLRWRAPAREGTAGPTLGYRVDFRRADTDAWEPAHDDLLSDSECKITNLEPLDTYFFRVSAANDAGFGAPSSSTSPIYINADGSAQIAGPARPSRPIVTDVGNDHATVEWRIVPAGATPAGSGSEIVGYIVEYRPEGASSWTASNDFPVSGPQHIVDNLRPNGDYEFQILSKDSEGRLSAPSPSSGLVRIRPAVPIRTTTTSATGSTTLVAPSQPQASEMGRSAIRLDWANSTSATDGEGRVGYVVEARECGDTAWIVISPPLLTDCHLTVEDLRPNTAYEFRVSAIGLRDGTRSSPSAPSALVHTRPSDGVAAADVVDPRQRPPERPARPEYLDFDGGNSVTICWVPAKSVLPVIGYEVEFRDIMESDSWQKFSVAPHIVQRCKTTTMLNQKNLVGNLFRGHQYQFRIFAHNANGRSPASDPSMLISIGTSLKDAKYVEAERHAAVALLQDEMIRESPPLPDRDDSPPPIYRQPPGDNLQYRDPTLKEVIDYLRGNDQDLIQNASSYLQRLTFNNDAVKEDTRNYGGIIVLVELLNKPNQNPEILRNVCGCLRNLAFGQSTYENKKQISECGGIAALANVIRTTKNVDVLEEATSALWNISSCDETKAVVLDKAAAVVSNFVVIPFSGFVNVTAIERKELEAQKCANIFRNGVGILRNVSAVNANARKLLRSQPNLIDAILHFFATAVHHNQIKSRAVENCVCLLRNISYRVQEIVDPKFDPNSRNNRHNGWRSSGGTLSARERSKSAPASPKNKPKKASKKAVKIDIKGIGAPLTREATALFPNCQSLGPSRLWHPETVKLYLHVLQECTCPEVLEASAAAIQNLAACYFDGSESVRTTVRVENGLPILCELLQLREDRVVCAMVTALRNLAIDPLNLQEIAKYAMRELIDKLPNRGQAARTERISDGTLNAVLGILYEMITFSAEMTLAIHNAGGTERLMLLERMYPAYGQRVCRNAAQVLYNMWKYKELHDVFNRAGLKEGDFHAATLSRGVRKPSAHGAATPAPGGGGDGVATLARPISSQGTERPSLLQNGSPTMQPQSQLATPTSANGINSLDNFDTSRSAPINGYGNHRQDRREPLYAAVNKNGGRSTAGDSWV